MDPKSSFARILARHRERSGDPVSLDELFALHEVSLGEMSIDKGTLAEEERADLLERVSADPDAAQGLLRLMRFPEGLPRDEHADEEPKGGSVDTSWKVFSRRLREDLEKSVQGSPSSPAGAKASRATPKRTQLWPMAASLVVGALLAFWLSELRPRGSGTPAPSWVNPPIVELLDDGSKLTREPSRVRLTRSATGVVVTLAVTDLPGTGPFDLWVKADGSKPGLLSGSISGLEPGPGDVFVVGLSRSILREGVNRLELRRGERTIAVFFLDLTFIQ